MIEKNKLIAEFMGLEYVSSLNKELGHPGWWSKNTPIELRKLSNYHKLTNYIGRSHNCLKYDESWDWLIPVVEEIESLDGLVDDMSWAKKPYSFKIEAYGVIVEIDRGISNAPFGRYNEKSKLESTYEAVIEFIRWYNNQKQL